MKSTLFIALSIISVLILTACSGGGSSGGSDNPQPVSAASVVLGQISPLPVLNGTQEFNFKVPAVNRGGTATNIKWSLVDIANNTVSAKTGSFFTRLFNKQAKTAASSGFVFNSNQCTSISANGSCILSITATSPDSKILRANYANGQIADTLLTAVAVSPSYSGESTDSLLVKINDSITVANGYTNYSFFIMNNSESAVINSVHVGLAPNGVTLYPAANCNSLAPQNFCQITAVLINNSSTVSGKQTQAVSQLVIRPQGSINGNSLPPQDSTTSLNISYDTGHVVLSYPSLTIYGDNEENTVTGLMFNNGSQAVTINTITLPVGFTLSNDNCSGKILQAGQSCSYNLTTSGSNISQSGYGAIGVEYNDGKIAAAEAISRVTYDYVAPIAASAPEINLSTNTTLLTVSESYGELSLSNTGNVALTNVSTPLSDKSELLVSDPNNCASKTINPHDSCKYALHYDATDQSEPTAAVLGGSITANYSDLKSGSTQSVTFDNKTIINLGNGTLQSNPELLNPVLDWTNSTSYTGSVELTNNSTNSITQISISTNPVHYLSYSGCSSDLMAGGKCTLTVSGNYPVESNNYTNNGNIIINYSISGKNEQLTIPVNASYRAKPIVMPALIISGNGFPQNMTLGSSQTFQVTLKNSSTSSNAGNKTLKVNLDSMQPVSSNNYIALSSSTAGVRNPCVADNSGYVSLTSGSSCNLNMTLTANAGTGKYDTITVMPSIEYYVYPDNSTTPVFTAKTLNSLSSDIINILPPIVAALNISTTATSSAFHIEVGMPAPNGMLTVTNVGGRSVNGGISIDPLSGFTFTPEASCTNLAVESSCLVSFSMATSTSLSGNLSSSMANYNDGYTNQSIPLPSLDYAVTIPDVPNISSMVDFGTSCAHYSVSDNTCYMNPDSDEAKALRLYVTYTNNSSAIAYQFSGAAPVIGIPGYTLSQNNCSGVSLAKSASCSVVYKLTNNTQEENIFLASGDSLGYYSYKYGAGQQLSKNANTTLDGNPIIAELVYPGISLNLESDTIKVNHSMVATAYVNDLYTGTGITIQFTSNQADFTLSAASCNIDNLVLGGGNCSIEVNAGHTTALQPNGVKAQLGEDVSRYAVRDFKVEPYYFYVAAKNGSPLFNGNLGGFAGADAICTDPLNAGIPGGKAVIAGTTRHHPDTDWTLYPNTQYNYYDDDLTTVMGVTNSNAVFDFPLSNAMASVKWSVWTGMNTDWSASNDNCMDWTSSASSVSGAYGYIDYVDSKAIYSSQQTCNYSAYLIYCASQ